MTHWYRPATVVFLAILGYSTNVLAQWQFSGPPSPPVANIQTDRMSLDLQCDRIRFAPAGYEDSQDIERKQGLSIRFLANGSTESGAFQAGADNAEIRIVDNYPVEVIFRDRSQYDFVLDQLAANAAVNLSMIDREVTYGILSLKGAGSAIRSLRKACAARRPEAPQGVVYCGGGGIKRQIEFRVLSQSGDGWNARVTVNGETARARVKYDYFGDQPAPGNFVFSLQREDRAEFLVFREGRENWLEFGDYTYRQCN
jgi:hypothetical protein